MARKTSLQVGFPFQLDTRGRVADPGYERHIREMIELVLFTAPGERVNRPGFGTGFLELVFSPNTAEEASVTQHLARAALQRELGDVCTVKSLTVEASEYEALRVFVERVRRADRTIVEFRRKSAS